MQQQSLTANDIEVLEDLKETLTPFGNGTVQTNSTAFTISLIIPLLKS